MLIELDHCLAAEEELELAAEKPRVETDELERMRPPPGRSAASMAAVSGVLMPLCLWLELGVCRLGEPSLPIDSVRLELLKVEGRLL